MSETTDFCLFGDTLRKYTGTEKDVVIPDGVQEIKQSFPILKFPTLIG